MLFANARLAEIQESGERRAREVRLQLSGYVGQVVSNGHAIRAVSLIPHGSGAANRQDRAGRRSPETGASSPEADARCAQSVRGCAAYRERCHLAEPRMSSMLARATVVCR